VKTENARNTIIQFISFFSHRGAHFPTEHNVTKAIEAGAKNKESFALERADFCDTQLTLIRKRECLKQRARDLDSEIIKLKGQ
jgi:hypothetical protein